MASSREQFLQTLSKWEHSVPLQTQWIAQITPINGLNKETLLRNIGSNTILDKSTFVTDQDIQNLLFNEQTQPNQDGLGLFCVQKASIPGENFSPTDAGTEGMGGFIKGNAGGDRLSGNNRTLGIEFLETNLDFIDGIIRPWIITASYLGLLARPPQYSIKANIQIVQYTRSNGSKARPQRKIHEFFNCVPHNIEPLSLNYVSEDVLIRTINWTFTNYQYKLVQPITG